MLVDVRHLQYVTERTQPALRNLFSLYYEINLLTVPGQIGANPVLPSGEHSFPFEVRLPEDNLPTTFEGKHGHVKYWLKAILDRPWKDEIKIVEPFTVTERIDVNQPEFLVRSCTDHSVQCKLHEYIIIKRMATLLMVILMVKNLNSEHHSFKWRWKESAKE